VAIDAEDRVLLVRQWRTPASAVLLEIPAGTLDRDHDTGAVENADLAARRELEEETGYRAGTWRKLAEFWTAPGFAGELMHLYQATDLTPAHPDERLGPDEDEHLRLERRPFGEAVGAVEHGEVRDAKSIVGLLWVARERAPGAASASPDLGHLVSAPEPSPGAIVRTFRMTKTDVALANAAAMRRSRAAQGFGVFFAAAAVLTWITGGDVLWLAYLVVFTILFWSGAFGGALAFVMAWRYPARVLPDITVSISDQGIDYRSSNASSTTAWGSIQRVSESGRFMLLSFPPATYLLPLRFFTADELRTICRILAEQGFGPDGRRRRSRGPDRNVLG
jgi:8-oxo-dGTP pyrophosphatase MutT (NUDIX family)